MCIDAKRVEVNPKYDICNGCHLAGSETLVEVSPITLEGDRPAWLWLCDECLIALGALANVATKST